MSLPAAIPAWMPGWLFLALIIPALLWFLAFLMVPFSVFGVKARLEAMESELEELNEQIRVMQLRSIGNLPTAAPSARVAEPLARSAEPYRGVEHPADLPNFAQLKRARAEPQPPLEEPEPEPAPARYPPIPTPQARSSPTTRDSLVPRERPANPPRPRRTEPRLD